MDLKLGALVLTGGHSRRMGTAKAMLPFGPETMLARMVRIVGEVCSPVVVVAAKDQALPELGPIAILARDSQPDCGPLEGIATGLRQMPPSDAAFITGCDAPLLCSAFIQRVANLLDEQHDAAVPVVDKMPQPLAGVYRPSVLTEVEIMLSSGHRRLLDLLSHLQIRRIDADEFRDVDPFLGSLHSVNTPDAYHAALAAAGFADENRC